MIDELPALVLLTAHNSAEGDAAANNIYRQLLDVEVHLAAAALLPMLRELQHLVKVCQLQGVFLHDLSTALQFTTSQLNSMYVSVESRFKGSDFDKWESLLDIGEPGAEVGRSPFQYDEEGHLFMRIDGDRFAVCGVPPPTGLRGRPRVLTVHADAELLQTIAAAVQSSMGAAAAAVLKQLADRFPPNELLEALSIVYPQWWISKRQFAELEAAVKVLCRHYGTEHSTADGRKVPALLDAKLLREQSSFFAQIAASASKAAMSGAGAAPVTLFWRDLSTPGYIADRTSEFRKAAELALVLVPGSVDEERTFSAMNFIKSDVRNRLKGDHLSMCIRLYSSQFHTVSTFPYQEAIDIWRQRSNRGRYMSNMTH